MPRRRANDDDAWADRHEGDCLLGSIGELRESNPPGTPFEPKRGPLGFLPLDKDGCVIVKKKRKCRKR